MAKVGAFDEHRPPAKELVDVCVHCGFCLPTCPTYLLRNEEMDSPRGRIVLMNVALEEESGELSDAMVTHWDRCLGCMACVTACPSGVRYDKLIEATRPQVERNYRRPLRDRAFRRLAFETFTHPGRLRALVPLMVAARKVGLTRAADRWFTRFPASVPCSHSSLPSLSRPRPLGCPRSRPPSERAEGASACCSDACSGCSSTR